MRWNKVSEVVFSEYTTTAMMMMMVLQLNCFSSKNVIVRPQVDALRPIVMAILKNLEHVDERFLKQLVTDKQLYQEADVGVKRQIWLYHQSLFGEELGPLFEQYMAVRICVFFLLFFSVFSFNIIIFMLCALYDKYCIISIIERKQLFAGT